jgi:hypothetical protein
MLAGRTDVFLLVGHGQLSAFGSNFKGDTAPAPLRQPWDLSGQTQ